MTNKPEKQQDEEVSDDGASSSDSEEWLKGVAHVPDRPPPRDRTGEKIGHYELKGPLGKGGMGVVYDAIDVRLQRRVALKLLSEDVINDIERRRRFLREAKLTAKVTHSNIVALYEVGNVDNIIFLAMERVIGATLRERMNEAKGPLPVRDAVRIAREIAHGVAEAHRHGVIHRDIKPENIMISRDGKVKLLDFGLAKALERAQPAVAYQSTEISAVRGRLLGTLRYMSPEQVRGMDVDERADVFAIGVVLYEMLSGARPFVGMIDADVMASILKDHPQPLKKVPAGISRIVMRCLSKDPNARYPNAEALAEAFDAPQWISRLQDFLVRSWFFLAVLLALVGIAALTPNRMLYVGGDARKRSLADSLPAEYEKSSGKDHYRSGLAKFRQANWGAAEREFLAALRDDPTLGPAHFRYALTQMSDGVISSESSQAYKKADHFRDQLIRRDRDLLDAMRPMFVGHVADIEKTTDQLQNLTHRYPNDAEIFMLLASILRDDTAQKRIAAADHALAIDPGYADAMQMKAAALFEVDPSEAMEVLQRCIATIEKQDGSNDCLGERARLNGLRGQCKDALEDLNRAEKDPETSSWILGLRPQILFSLGEPEDVVSKALAKYWERSTPALSAADQHYDRALLAAAFGDFNSAKAEAAVGRELNTSGLKLAQHERFALLQVEIEIEQGNNDVAARIANDFVTKFAGFYGERSFDEPTVYLARIAMRGGLMTSARFQNERDELREHLDSLTPIQMAQVWGLEYVMGIQSAEEATQALDKRPDESWFVTRSDQGVRYFPRVAALGQAYYYAGNMRKTIDYLGKNYRRCDFMRSIFVTMRSNLLYAKALQSTGEAQAACEVYQSIVKRWGNAQPPSVTAQEAQKGRDRVCPKAQ